MPLEDDDDKPRLPMVVYLVIGVLAVIGLFSIMSVIVSGVLLIFRLAVALAVVVLVFYALKAVFWRGNGRAARDATESRNL
jgi:hypothetical protein